MAMKRAFISFDFDHDEELRDALKGQSRSLSEDSFLETKTATQ